MNAEDLMDSSGEELYLMMGEILWAMPPPAQGYAFIVLAAAMSDMGPEDRERFADFLLGSNLTPMNGSSMDRFESIIKAVAKAMREDSQ